MVKVKKILVTTDLSEESRSAMEYAVWLSEQENAHIILLYCVDNLPTVAYHTVDLTFDKFRDEIMKQEKKRLKDFAAISEKNYGVKVSPALIEGNASHEIVEYAQLNDIDIIVMNTHGRTGIQHTVLGSVAERVVRKSPCPVLTIRSSSLQVLEQKAGKKIKK